MFQSPTGSGAFGFQQPKRCSRTPLAVEVWDSSKRGDVPGAHWQWRFGIPVNETMFQEPTGSGGLTAHCIQFVWNFNVWAACIAYVSICKLNRLCAKFTSWNAASSWTRYRLASRYLVTAWRSAQCENAFNIHLYFTEFLVSCDTAQYPCVFSSFSVWSVTHY